MMQRLTMGIVVVGLALSGCGPDGSPQASPGSVPTALDHGELYEQGRAQAEADASYRAGYNSLAQERAAVQAIAEAEAAAAEAEWEACVARARDAGAEAAEGVRDSHAVDLAVLDEPIDAAFEAPVDTFDERAVAAHDAGVLAAMETRNEAVDEVESEAQAAAEQETEATAAAGGCYLD